VLYEGGIGVPQSYAKAVAWYQKAADQGNANAQENLSILKARATEHRN
jgi:TPR repeat protein